MNFFFSTLRKVLVGITAVVFAFAVVYVPQNHTSKDTVPTASAQVAGVNTATETTQIVHTTTNAAALVVTKVLNGIAYHIAKTMIAQMLRSTIVWINSGFKGSPAFIQDLDRFLLNVADEAAGEYIRSLGEVGSFICSPFRLDIQLALSLKYQKARERKNIDSCTLSGIVGNVEKFFNNQIDRKDFWKQWVEVTSKPERYSPYGQYMAADAELNARLVNAKGRELEIAKMGDGFLSSKVCEPVEGPTTAAIDSAKEKLTAAVNSTSTTSGAAAAGSSLGGGLAAAAAPKQNCVISTPGKVISEQLNKMLGAGQDQLVAADQINEVISALMGQIANQALTGAAGLLGLSVGTGYTAGGYGSGSYVDELASQARNSANSFSAQNFAEISEKLKVQKDYNALAIQYIPKLQTIIDGPSTLLRFRGLTEAEIRELKSRAQFSYSDAIYVRDASREHINYLNPLVTSYERLQKELTASTTTEVRKQAIATEQSQIISQTSGYQAFTIYRMRESAREWGNITGS
jgi:hypothetical protein